MKHRPQKLFLQLILHLLLRFRSLRNVDCYQDDPLVQRVLGLGRGADPSTISRTCCEIRRMQRLLPCDASCRPKYSGDCRHWRCRASRSTLTDRCNRRRDVLRARQQVLTSGSQEGISGALKTDVAMRHVPVRTRNGNQAYLIAGLMGHNLLRELQMRQRPPQCSTTAKRAALWVFEHAGTLRRRVFQRDGKLTRPSGRLILTINASEPVQQQILCLRDAASEKAAA